MARLINRYRWCLLAVVPVLACLLLYLTLPTVLRALGSKITLANATKIRTAGPAPRKA